MRILPLHQNCTSFKAKPLDIYRDFVKTDGILMPLSKENTSLTLALKQLENLHFDKDDVEKVKRFGVTLAFQSGSEALDFAKTHQIPIIFDRVSSPDIHAQWQNDRKTIVINDKYRSTNNPAEIYAISSAIMHELSHAKDNDGLSSIQEELDCLAMNALAFNVFKKQSPELFNKITSPIISDGVEVYSSLFLGNDEKALKARVKSKYGNLDVESPNHSAKAFAKDIKKDR